MSGTAALNAAAAAAVSELGVLSSCGLTMTAGGRGGAETETSHLQGNSHRATTTGGRTASASPPGACAVHQR